MNDKYKLVPMEPTEGMIDSGQCASFRDIETQDAVRIYEAMLAAAPEVEQEPVGYANSDELDNMLDDRTAVISPVRNSFHTKPLYLHPQPAEHHPECGCCGQTYRCDDDCDAVVIGGHRAADQQPAPEVAMLVEALESLMKGYASLIEGGIDRITHLSGDCDLIPDMLRNAREALATYREQGGGK